MNGVIVYADDDVLTEGCFENRLFKKFLTSLGYCVVPVTTLESLDDVLKSMSVIRALILDWSFKDDDPDIPGGNNKNPQKILENYKPYALVYVYSREELSDDVKTSLIKVYGNKIHFSQKNEDAEEGAEFERIKKDLVKSENENKHMEIPCAWASCISQATQSIFRELELADPGWIGEIYRTAKNDGGEPSAEVVGVFSALLLEALLQNRDLKEKLENQNSIGSVLPEKQNTAKLYQRIYYSKVSDDTPISTGDIYSFGGGEFGILITPECEIHSKKDISLEFLIFSSNDFEEHLRPKCQHKDKEYRYNEAKEKFRESLRQKFNNGEMSVHFLPVFPFVEEKFSDVACINFKTAFSVKRAEEFKEKRISYKLNSPYIQQLRQRFIAFWGRYGVPAVPDSLREICLSSISFPKKEQ